MPPSDFEYPQQQLEYARAIPGRPGVLTTLGIFSIIVGSLSALASASGIFTGIMYIAMSKMPMLTPVITTTSSTVTNSSTAPSPSASATMSAAAAASAGGAPASGNTAASFTSVTVTSSGQTVTTSTNVQSPAFGFRVAPGASELTITESILSLLAAVVLIFAGSLQLRDSPKAWRLHRIFLLVKLPLIFVAAFATYWTTSSMMSSFNVSAIPGAAPKFQTMAVGQAIFLGIFSLIYPVALLIVLATRTSRDYLKQITGAAE